MEESNEQSTQEKKKTRATKSKKEVNSRISDVIQRLEVEEKEKIKKTTPKVKKETKKQDVEKEKETSTNSKAKVTSTKANKIEKSISKKSSQSDKNVKDKKENKEKSDKKEETKKVATNKKENKIQKDKKVSNEEADKVVIDKKEKTVANSEEKKSKKKINKKEEPTPGEKMQKIEEERKKQKKLPKEIKEKVNKAIFSNFIIAIAISIYLIFINLGYTNINEEAFITDLQVFSITLIITTILVFEHAYKKDSGKITIYGIETLVLSIVTMILPRIYNENKELFVDIVGCVSIIFIIYYFIKCMVIYFKTKRRVRKKEMKKIAKK